MRGNEITRYQNGVDHRETLREQIDTARKRKDYIEAKRLSNEMNRYVSHARKHKHAARRDEMDSNGLDA